MFFKVLQGRHVGRNGKTYMKDEVVESEEDLRKVFRDKFEEVDGPIRKKKLKKSRLAEMEEKAAKPTKKSKRKKVSKEEEEDENEE